MKSKIKFDLSDRTNMFYWQTNRQISAEDMKKVFLDRRNTVSIEDTKKAIEYGMQKAGKSTNDAKVVKIGNPIPNGSVNNALKAELADGTEVVVRMHPYYVQNGYFWAESIAAKQAKAAGVPTFDTYFIDDTKSHFDFDFIIMEAMPGKTMQDFWPLSDNLEKTLIEETGKYAAIIHSVKTKGYGFFQNKIAKNEKGLEGQYSTFKDHIFAGIEEDFKFLTQHEVLDIKTANKIENTLSHHEDLLSCAIPSLIHNDIADWNQLSDGKHVTAMIDWDECFSGDSIMDFAQWSLFFDDNRLKHFINGYKSITHLPDSYEDKAHLFRLRYVVSKLHLRKKRALVHTDNQVYNNLIGRGLEVLAEELKYFGIN